MALFGGFSALNEATVSQPTTSVAKAARVPAVASGHPEVAEDTSTSSEDSSQWSQTELEAGAHAAYNRALGLFGEGRFDQAAAAFTETLHSTFLSKRRFRTNKLRRRLRANSLKYLGFSLSRLDDHEAALGTLIEALEATTDEKKDDVNLCFRLGVAALRTRQAHRLPLARAALERAMRASPGHWPSLDLLVSITYRLGDFQACLAYSDEALRRDPTCQKAKVLAHRIISEEPAFKCLCPNLVVGESEEVNQNGMIKVPKIVSFKHDPEESIVRKNIILETHTWADLLSHLIKEKEDWNRTDTTPADEFTIILRCSDPLAVSVQNLVQQMVDLVSDDAMPLSRRVVDLVVDDLVSDAVCASSQTLVAAVIDDILGVVVAGAKPGAVVAPLQKRSSRAIISSVVQEIPLDLLDVRRSSRVKGGGPIDCQTQERGEEITAQSLLESFIPPTLRKCVEKGEKRRARRASGIVDKEESSSSSPPLQKFPGENAQAEEIKEFISSLKPTIIEEIVYDVLFRLKDRWHCRWPKRLKAKFVKAYCVWRSAIQLPGEFRSDPMPYLDVMLLTYEIVNEGMKEKWDKFTPPSFLEDDFLHMRLCYPKMDRNDAIRVFYIHYNYYKEKDKVRHIFV